MAKPALGRGLGALLGGAPIAKPQVPVPASPTAPVAPDGTDSHERIQRVPLSRVHPCPFQPRKEFSADGLRELADSIKEQGIVQPLVVRERNGHFELIAGERRWRAAQLLGLAEIPIILRKADDRAVLELALIENLQRENLNAMEEAQGYSQLIQQFKLTQEEVSQKVGKSRASVANALRLLKLPAGIQTQIRENRLSVGHAKVVLGLLTEQQQTSAAEQIIREGLNVRQTEELVARILAPPPPPESSKPGRATPLRDANVTSLEERLREKFGTKVRLRYAQGKGALEISFFSDAELQRVLDLCGIGND
jgi:ParB family transcriptional regulator, chromosome partitioning protein